MSAPPHPSTFTESAHPRAGDGRFATKHVAEAAGGLDALGPAAVVETATRHLDLGESTYLHPGQQRSLAAALGALDRCDVGGDAVVDVDDDHVTVIVRSGQGRTIEVEVTGGASPSAHTSVTEPSSDLDCWDGASGDDPDTVAESLGRAMSEARVRRELALALDLQGFSGGDGVDVEPRPALLTGQHPALNVWVDDLDHQVTCYDTGEIGVVVDGSPLRPQAWTDFFTDLGERTDGTLSPGSLRDAAARAHAAAAA
ncbi:hypothetical protein [Isoptericola croceus]|uniref:hypothetical protein n=1 Tax=Isoptericola croceus TaxID=3031406 RepID=UPI0023F799E5|nr:hypothetical protein [Isoptericola croceus]